MINAAAFTAYLDQVVPFVAVGLVLGIISLLLLTR